jgi:N,N-dimethylformamidase beta subunit-like, C-terminal
VSGLPRKRIIGYADQLSVAPGETIAFKASAEGMETYHADIVRLISGDLHPDGRGLIERVVETSVSGDYPAREQPIHAGSYAAIEDDGPLTSSSSFTLACWIWPTLPGSGEQVIMGAWDVGKAHGRALVLDADGAAALWTSDGSLTPVSTGVPLLAREWAWVGASFDGATGELRVWQRPAKDYPGMARAGEASGKVMGQPEPEGLEFRIAAASDSSRGPRAAGHLYNGKIDAPRVAGAVLDEAGARALQDEPAGCPTLLAAWDFSRDMTTDRIRDSGPYRLDGRLVNLPARAMKGHNWTGAALDWTKAPEEYGAIHFHDDDIYDCGWQIDLELTVPDGLESGVYAARLTAGDDTDHIPFAVLPPRGRATAEALFLMPSASYMAYANEHAAAEGGGYMQAFSGHLSGLSAQDLLLDSRPDLGYSLYDHHSDGSGVCYSSRLRPVLNFRPGVTNAWVGPAGTFPWQFNADLPLIDWLDHEGVACDVATDEDLEEQGLDLLRRYRVVLTGSHPEYYSFAMHEALSIWLDQGGRMMYLGGNGFYWRVAYHPSMPGVIELRRGEDGIRDWVAEGGEYYHSFDGTYGGMWERQGRPIHALAGVGMAGQGFDASSYYRRTAASRDPRAAFIFEGIDDEIIGDFGTVGGGAAGIEVDRYDRSKGSPPHALVLASSEAHSDAYYPGPEEIDNASSMMDGSQNPKLRADLVFFETAEGGAVFSTGSIAWIGSLSWNGFDNNVARLTGNVLRRFLRRDPFVVSSVKERP